MFIVFKKLSWFFRLEWKRYTIAIILLNICGFIEVIPPRLIGNAIDGIHTGTMSMERLTHLLFLYGGLIVASYILTYVWIYKLFGGSIVLERLLRSKLMRHLLKMTPTFYERNRTGDLMARATNDLTAVSTTAGFGILTLVDSTVYMCTILGMMGFLISWKLTLAALIPLPLMAYIMGKLGNQIHGRFMRAQDAFGDMNDRVLETIAGVRVIRAFVQETATEQRFQDMTTDVYRKNIAVTQIDSLFEPIVKILVSASYLIGLCYGGYLVFHSQLTPGELVTFNVFLGMLIWPMMAIGELINVMQRGNASLDRVNETLGYKPDVVDHEGHEELKRPETIIFDQVSFRYPSSTVDNLIQISLTLKQGQTLGIVGKTGSGKTTLLRQLLREYPLGQGTISISDIPLQQLNTDNIHGWLGYVPQQPVLFSKTIRENILLGGQNATEDELQNALELASFSKEMKYLPDGIHTLVGEKGVALSGGQKQRVSIARALIANPEILILDDALSAVDAKTETKIVQGIRNQRAGRTTLITTHRLSAVQHADWIIVMDEGAIIEEGTHDHLVQQNGWYREQYDRQQIEAQIEA
ncbi:ATP-binding cassette domain-containing protein [Paenibacillus psychroresistens]|uniref:ATP-binding cassette domain-containing protein n=1 Tax=Paenibacillus psychroresistens TaxID=1778678 RepID=A0A6B8RSM9_9BACL|nr:ABC transporter transmembrane domain-containing protein [Paenibacillus psychroresistens]QGQ99451.1 ATP-binding cassette domain-containing protein [Paenibacillus psychroresistens]